MKRYGNLYPKIWAMDNIREAHRNAQRFKVKVVHIKRAYRSMSSDQVINGLMSYWGWLKYGNCLHLAKRYIDTDIRRIVGMVSKMNGIKNPLRRLKWL